EEQRTTRPLWAGRSVVATSAQLPRLSPSRPPLRAVRSDRNLNRGVGMTGSSSPVRRARRTGLRLLTAALGATALVAGPLVAGPARAASCSPAGPSGLTAAMIVASGQTLSSQTVDATGCDIGIYLAPGTTGVTINGVTVSG